MSLIDSNRFGIAFKNKNPQAKIAENFPDIYIQSKMMDINQSYLPTIVSNTKRSYLNFRLQDSIMPCIHGITGYFSGIYTGLVHNAVPIALGIGALAFKRAGKYCAIGLGLIAAKTLFYNVLGIGQYKKM